MEMTNMFIGRENELATLNRLYSSNNFEFAVIYGRRCVSKTALVSEFSKDKEMNEISNIIIDEDTSVCVTYIKSLITLGIDKRDRPTVPTTS